MDRLRLSIGGEEEIGESLGVQPASLDCMAITKRDDPGGCLRDVVATWLRMSSTPEHPITVVCPCVSVATSSPQGSMWAVMITQEISYTRWTVMKVNFITL